MVSSTGPILDWKPSETARELTLSLVFAQRALQDAVNWLLFSHI